MSDDPLVKFEMKISNRVYPILMHPSEQELVEDIQREINESMSNINEKYAGQDRLDVMAMAFISYAFEVKKNQAKESISKK